jgi:hypothetical protein
MQNEKIMKFINWINDNNRVLRASFTELEGRPAIKCELGIAYHESFGVDSEDLPPEDKWGDYCEQRFKMLKSGLEKR